MKKNITKYFLVLVMMLSLTMGLKAEMMDRFKNSDFLELQKYRERERFERERMERELEKRRKMENKGMMAMSSQLNETTPAEYEFDMQIGTHIPYNGTFEHPSDLSIDSAGNIYVADTYNHRIQKFDSSGNFLMKFGSYGTGDGEFKYPQGMAIDNEGNICVADMGNDRIQKFDSDGNFIMKFGGYGTGDGEFNDPEGVAIDSDGNIYVADTYNDRIQKFNSSGNFLMKFGSDGSGDGEFNNPEGVAIDSDGNIYVADTRNHRIQKFDSTGNFVMKFGVVEADRVTLDIAGNIYVLVTYGTCIQKFDSTGNFVMEFGSRGSGDGQFYSPKGILIDIAGNIYVADTDNNRIQKFDSSGNFIFKFGYKSFLEDGQINNPNGVAVDSLGNIYVADTDNNRIQKFDSSGNFLMKFGSEGSGNSEFNNPEGVAIDSAGNIYVVDYWNDRIQKFDSSGNFLMKFGSEGSGNSEFNNPEGVAIDSAGNIYVADADIDNNRIQKFDSEGNFLMKFGGRWGSGDGEFKRPFGISLDGAGNIYVSDTGNDRIQKFDSSGNFLTKFGSEGTGDGEFISPMGVAVDNSGNIYVSDIRIQKFKVLNSISGTITDGETAISGVEISLTGDMAKSTTTDVNGNYVFEDIDALGNYTITPSDEQYTFTPASISTTNLVGSWMNQNFTAVLNTYNITGTITDGELGMSEVEINLTGDMTKSTTTDSNGNYVFEGIDALGVYTLTPSKEEYSFTPVSKSTTSLVENWTNQNFTAVLNTYQISGTITDGELAIAGVEINLTGDMTKSTTTDSSGNYVFEDIEALGDYTITPSKDGYTFTPTSISTTSLSGNWTNQNFTAQVKFGSVKWKLELGSQIHSCPSIDDDGIIYFGANDGKLYAVNPDGTKKWEYYIGSNIYSSPSIGATGRIYIGADDRKLYAIKSNGSKDWSFQTDASIKASPAIASNGTIYIGSLDGKLYAVNPNGSKKWEYNIGSEIYSSPVIAGDGTIYIGALDGKLYAINSDGTKKWEFATSGAIVAGASIANDGTIYIGSMDENLYAVNSDGSEKWTAKLNKPVLSSAVIDGNGIIYVSGYAGFLYAFNSDGIREWFYPTYNPDEGFISTPALDTNGMIYVGRENGFSMIHTNEPITNITNSYITNTNFSSPVIADDGTLYVGSTNGTFYAFNTLSEGLEKSAWPMFGNNIKHTARTGILKAPIDRSKEKELKFDSSFGEIKLTIPAQTFTSDIELELKTLTPTQKNTNEIKTTSIGLEIKNDLNLQPQKPIELVIPYRDSDIVDLDETKLIIMRYTDDSWIPLPSRVDIVNKKITATLNHFSTFAVVMYSPHNTLQNAKAYPVPFDPLKDTEGLKIENLTANSSVKIYTILGQLVKELKDETGNGYVIWDGKNESSNVVARGIYLLYIKDDKDKKVLKIAVEK